MIRLFQQRDFGKKINATFQYITQNFQSLGLSLLYIVGPVALVAGIATGLIQSNLMKFASTMGNDGDANPMAAFQLMAQFLSPTFWLAMFFSLMANLAVILTTYAHMKVYDRADGREITVPEVWAEVQPMIGRGILILILNSIITGFGFVFFVIPGIYLAVALSLSLAVMSFEETDFGSTWTRCFQLIRDKWWSTFGLIFVMGIIALIIGLVFSLPNTVVTILTSAKMLPDVPVVWLVISNVISLVGKTILNVMIYTAIGFQYTNLVERQEGRGMLSAIDSIGTAPTQPRPADDETY